MSFKKSFFLILFFITLNSFSQNIATPIDYLSYISKEQQNIAKNMWKYTKSVAHSKSARKIDATRKSLLNSIQLAKKNISGLKEGYKSDIEYRDVVINYLIFSENMISQDYSKIIDMQEVAEQSYDFMEAFIMTKDLVNQKMAEEYEKVDVAQKSFALKYNIILNDSESDIAKKMKISNEVFQYQNETYLIFFKCNITDALLLASVQKKDIAAIQQNSSTLSSYVDEGLEKLKTMNSYNNDASLKNITIKTLEMYKKTNEEYVPNVIDFYMFNTKFHETKTALESKSAKERTKEEVDNFNKMVNDVNKKINDFNNLNVQIINQKNKTIAEWNATSEKFISKHVPND
ncbi:conserved exported hypothetical protein [Flavobacterium sp. 9AF]|uniref:LIC11966 family surface protein n=1 Tax=Flavobacterium sp. 9AF TaxID=2653142 RepID=UPI0012F0C406|nr:hypothetical protein [Flavobacterium sp. 9AF]VXB73228.1 conserved exported hypothetical protein [Flavobacterium sp. 9AF]